jgi:hypothetical protein
MPACDAPLSFPRNSDAPRSLWDGRITSAVDARHFSARKIAYENQQRRYKGQFQRGIDREKI